MNQRIVHKGNVTKGSYDVRITETDGKEYYYHFSCHGNYKICSIWILHNNLFNLRREREESWDKLPFEVKEKHYKKIHPNDDLDDYEKNCFFYGKEKADEMIAAEKKEEFLNKVAFQHHICGYYMAEVIYDHIGPWESIEVMYERGGKGKFCIDNKIITVECYKIVSIEDEADYEAGRKAWGQRISQIAKAAGTSFEMATVVGNITIDTNAIEILKEVVKRLNSDDFKEYMNRNIYYSKYTTDDMILKDGIRAYLRDEVFSHSIVTKLKFSNKFSNEVKKILNNKK